MPRHPYRQNRPASSQRRAAPAGEEGFSVIEASVAIGVLLIVLVGMLGSLGAAVRGVVDSRNREAALAEAQELLEEVRAQEYRTVGHDLTGDSGLTDDDAVGTNASGDLVFEAETLIGVASPADPFAPHQVTWLDDGTTYDRRVYVTAVDTADGSLLRRVTVVVGWATGQYGSGTVGRGSEVRMSTLLADIDQPADPELDGVADVEGGSVVVTGELDGELDNDLRLLYARARSGVDGGFVTRVNGFAETAGAQGTRPSGGLSGCSTSGSEVVCGGARAETVADDDAGTPPPDEATAGPLLAGAITFSAGTPAQIEIPAGGTAETASSARSASVGDGDGLPSQSSDATGPAGPDFDFDLGPAEGEFADRSGSVQATGEIDVDDVGSDRRIASTATATYDAVDVMVFDEAVTDLYGTSLGDYAGAVRVSAGSATATATAGPGAPDPSVSGSDFTVDIYEAVGGVNGYTSHTVTPGSAFDATSRIELKEDTATVLMDVVVHASPGSTSTETDGTTVTASEASLPNWLWVDITFTVTTSSGTHGDATVHLDYGRLLATGSYEEPVT